MFFHYATIVGALVEYWEGVSGEGDHVSTELGVKVVECSFDELFIIAGGGGEGASCNC